MEELLLEYLPNLMKYREEFWEAIQETLLMLAWSGGISIVLGLFFGVAMAVTKKGQVMEQKQIYTILDKLISLFRSIPFIILLTWVMPLSRSLMGTGIGVKGVIVPLVFGCVPFFARQVENALAEIDHGLIEAATAMGLSPFDIIIRVYLRESFAGIIRGTTITAISLLNLTAMAGAVGAGGLGDFAIRYGHDRNMSDITNITVLTLVIFVVILEWFGSTLMKKWNKNK